MRKPPLQWQQGGETEAQTGQLLLGWARRDRARQVPGSSTPSRLGSVRETVEATGEVAWGSSRTAGLGLPLHSCHSGRAAIYCKGLSGAQAAPAGHRADLSGASAPC